MFATVRNFLLSAARMSSTRSLGDSLSFVVDDGSPIRDSTIPAEALPNGDQAVTQAVPSVDAPPAPEKPAAAEPIPLSIPPLEMSAQPAASATRTTSPRSGTISGGTVNSPRTRTMSTTGGTQRKPLSPPSSPRKMAEELIRRASTSVAAAAQQPRKPTTTREMSATVSVVHTAPKLHPAPENASQDQMDVTDLVHRLLNDETRNEAVRGLDNMLEKEINCNYFTAADGYSVAAYLILTANDQSQTAVLTLLTKLASKMKRSHEMQKISTALAEYLAKASHSRLNRLLSLRLLRTVVLAGLPNKEAFVRARGPLALLSLIQDSNAPEPQGLAIFSLGALLAIPNEADQNAVVARRVIASQIAEQPALLEAVKNALLSRESLVLKLSASFMWNYSLAGLPYRKAIAAVGAVPLLVALLPHHNEEVTWQAAGALRNMVLENEELSIELVTQHRAFEVVAARYPSINANTVKGALLSLCYSLLYTKHEAVHAIFAETEALALFVGISKSTTELPETIAHAVGCLRNHVGNFPRSQDAIRDHGGIDSAFALLNHDDERVRENAVSLIWASTSGHPVNQVHVLRSGVLNRIISMLDSSADLTVTNACAAIRSLTMGHKDTQNTLREAGVMPKLISLLVRGTPQSVRRNPAIAEYSCLAMHALISDNVANADALLALGVMSPLAALFHSQARGLLSAAAMLCKHLLEIDSTAEVLKAIVEAKGVDALTVNMNPRNVEDLRHNCAFILRVILRSYIKEARSLLGEYLLLNLAAPALDPHFHAEVLDTLSVAGYSSEVQSGARDAGLGALVALLSSPDAGIHVRAAIALVSLCHLNGRTQSALLEANALPPLLSLLFMEDMRVAVPACKAVAVLTDNVNLWLWNTEVQNRVLDYPDTVHAMVGFCRAPEHEAKDAALHLIHAVAASKNKRAQSLIGEAGATPLLVSMLGDATLPPNLITRVVQCIYSLINQHSENITRFKNAGAAGAIEAVAERGDQKQKELANQILAQFKRS